MTGHINRHHLQDYLNFYFTKWPEIEKSIKNSLDKRIRLDSGSQEQNTSIVSTK